MNITTEPDVMSADAFQHAKNLNNWVVLTKYEVEKGKEDISKLTIKMVEDSIGRRRTVYVKDSSESIPEDDSAYEEAVKRHTHNTKVQRMGKESSFKQMERHYSKDIINRIREANGLKASPFTVVIVHKQPKSPDIKSIPLPVVKRTDINIDELISVHVDKMVTHMDSHNKHKVDAMWRNGITNNFILLKEYIDSNNYGMLRDFLMVENPAWRSFYIDYTGVKLPPSNKDTILFLFKHTGAINS